MPGQRKHFVGLVAPSRQPRTSLAAKPFVGVFAASGDFKKSPFLYFACGLFVCAILLPFSPSAASAQSTAFSFVNTRGSLERTHAITSKAFPIRHRPGILLGKGEWGTLTQAQTAPPPGGQPLFTDTYIYVAIGFLAAGLIVGVGEGISRMVKGDLLPWRIAGVVLNGASLAFTAYTLASFMQQFNGEPALQILFWGSLLAAGIGFLISAVQLVIQIHQRLNKPKPKETKKIAVVPWANVDPMGHAQTGLAVVGTF